MRKYIPNIKLSYTFPLFLVLIMLTGRYKLYFIFYLLCFIHELGHIITSLLFHCKCETISILPFGINASIKGKERLKSYQECLIYLAGPFMYFINIYVIDFLFSNNLLSYIGYIRANESNLLILIFNLLPILPLDGGNILRCILTRFLRVNIAYKISLYLSILMLLLLIIATSSTPQYVIYTFLIFEQVNIYLNSKNEYINLLLKRNSSKYRIKVHSHLDIYKDKHNYYVNENVIEDENLLCNRIIANTIKKDN